MIPCEGSVVYPYVIGLVKNAPDKEKAKKVLDYILSDKGQAIWTNAYLRPARPIELPEAVKAKFLPDSDYARAKSRRLGPDGERAKRLCRSLSRRGPLMQYGAFVRRGAILACGINRLSGFACCRSPW